MKQASDACLREVKSWDISNPPAPHTAGAASWPITMEQTLNDSFPGYLKKKGNGDSRVFFLVNFHFNQETTRKQNSEALFPSVLY